MKVYKSVNVATSYKKILRDLLYEPEHISSPRGMEIKEILKREEITPRDFIIRAIPELSSEGDKRKVYSEVKELKIKKINEKTIELEFILQKGRYETKLISQFFQN